ncbi:PREDICTED: kinesin-like protein KIN-12E [Tarenaya hassleriana]|uniref:kinesin-like protein KIN-12E n=1 Tax=Tarenaya hassleriana TaxID=28532 RepID=UPI00053C780C|nr:PREDICTED: kinesin-like protein KIN-12E [Tarenaya hassleriana]
MPFITETASAIKRRFGFNDRSVSETVRPVPCTPDISTVARENHSQSLAVTSAIRSMGDLDEEGTSCDGSVQLSRSRSFEFNEDPSFWKDHNVQVVIRIRPLSSSEVSLQGQNKCVRQESGQTITWTGHPESRFTFDLVADEYVTQEKLFKVAGVPMVENCVAGYNSCMFAYGQTGSGKTHTMLGDIEGGTRRHSVNCGMTPRVFEYMFSRIQKEKETRKEEKLRFTCRCSFLEIYNEQILDLLDPSSNNLQLREDNKRGIHVENLKEIEVTSARDVIQQLLQGAANRKVAATNMNRASSRSHSVFTCVIESKWEAQGVTHHRFARLNLVDLAGSERQKSSGAEGERLKEATNINKSLSTLGLVIMNLVSVSNGKSVHVPYRDSKLTFLLQDSLGGNSKTIIIANISPSTSCSLETLSTLKFAQRAKLIKNNAIINEDASGDVIAMRLQIQQLKKEVSRLRGLVNGGGGENQDADTVLMSYHGSPISLKWDGLDGSFSPLTTHKRMTKAKDYEVALVGAFRREKEKDTALQSLAAENEAALQLAKQREDEIRGLKMILKLRDSAIKRLEAVASGKISAETHLQKEKDDCLKEIEVLRAKVNRNQEVTKFAMENLRLKEEIRRLKSYCEEGEQYIMNEQIKVLQDKLLQALDWKLMHESDSSTLKDRNGGNLLISNENQDSKKLSSLLDENEFLRLQAIQSRAEMEALGKSLSRSLEEKERLEKCVEGLVKELEELRSSGAGDVSRADASAINLGDDQMEVKTMVEAIACASHREAEIREKAIKLSKENDELRRKIKVLIEDNNKLIELYEQVAAENNSSRSSEKTEGGPSDSSEEQNNVEMGREVEENGVELKKQVENLENQLTEMHEENEKLMSLYENAMKERDEFKRLISSPGHNRTEKKEVSCPEKLVEVDGETCVPMCIEDEEDSVEEVISDRRENPDSEKQFQTDEETKENCPDVESNQANQETRVEVCGSSDTEMKPCDLHSQKFWADVEAARLKLEVAEEKLSDSADAIAGFSSLERIVLEINRLTKQIEEAEEKVREHQKQLGSLKLVSKETEVRKARAEKKLSALRYSLTSLASSIAYFEQRESRARARVNASSSHLNQKKEEISVLRSCKKEIDASLGRIQQSEAELKSNIVMLKVKIEEENRRHEEEEKVLFAIDNIEKINTPQKNTLLTGKALDLLKSEEEKTKLQAETKLSREKLGSVRKELDEMIKKSSKLETKIQTAEIEIERASKALEELELALQNTIQEEQALHEMVEQGKFETESTILEVHQLVFESDLSENEKIIVQEEIKATEFAIKDMQRARAETMKQALVALEENGSDKIRGEVENVLSCVLEAKSLLDESDL